MCFPDFCWDQSNIGNGIKKDSPFGEHTIVSIRPSVSLRQRHNSVSKMHFVECTGYVLLVVAISCCAAGIIQPNLLDEKSAFLPDLRDDVVGYIGDGT